MTTQSPIRTATRVRQEFLDFFRARHAHVVVPSSPVIPHDDPTLLFTNAGMNQFKDVFLGRGERPYTRAVDTQKCIRAGGKHNDLEDVGKDTYHHTFFEMLGNWSFGDYFKTEAIEWAWELLTGVWGIDPDRLYVTVFAGSDEDGLGPDVEAEDVWKSIVSADRISRWGRKDNFWEMGETGPCGPCSEIHYDGRPDEERRRVPGADLVNRDHPDVVEIWNLVFIQFDRGPGGKLTPLPARHVDTGMGLERLVRVLQGKSSNYDTDLWEPIFAAIAARTGARPYTGAMDDPVDIAYRVIADHLRCLTVAIGDGALPGNEGRGYVLRRILRRAVRHAHQTLGVEGAALCDIVPVVVKQLVEAFPDLAGCGDRVADVLREEEEQFLRTLDRGIALFDEAAAATREAGATTLSAESAFRLHDTYGFPIDLTRVMAEERGLAVDEDGYETLMDEARERSRATGDRQEQIALPPEAMERLRHLGVAPTVDDARYAVRPLGAEIKAIWNGRDFDNVAHVGTTVAVILSRTNHYAEAGGQVGDAGKIEADVFDLGAASARGYSGRQPSGGGRFTVEDTQVFGGYVLHIGRVVDGKLSVGDRVTVTVDRARRQSVAANHTATHLLNHALREILGDDTHQRGSLVAPDRLRFDFTSSRAMSDDQAARAEALVNEAIAAGATVYAETVPVEAAKKIHGLRAVFGERYPDPVRVVSIGRPVADLLADPGNTDWRAHSVEFCGGTHLEATDEARRFVLLSEQALAAGIRRVIALTGAAALAAEAAGRELLERVTHAVTLGGEELAEAHDDIARQCEHMTLSAPMRRRIDAALAPLKERIRADRKSAQTDAREGAVAEARAFAERAAASGARVIIETVDAADKDALLPALDVIRALCPDAAAMLFAPGDEAKVAIAAAVPEAMIRRGLKAGDWVREAAKVCGGGGGGRPDLAQAGGKDPTKIGEATEVARAFAERALS